MPRFLTVALVAFVALAGCASEDPAPDPAPDTPEATETTEVVAAGECVPAGAQDLPSPGGCDTITLGETNVEVQYHRPAKKDREIFGSLVPFDQVWRTGANEATTITTSGPLTIGSETLPAGTYGLFTIPSESQWTVIVNEVAEQWGAFEYDDSRDVLRVMASPEASTDVQERFSITFEDGADGSATMVMTWDDVRVPVSISAAG